MSIEVYTSITGENKKDRDDVVMFDRYNKFVKPIMNAKIYKILPHKFLDNDITVWLDGNIFLLANKEQMVEEFLGDADMALFKHPYRDCIYEEAEAAKGLFNGYNQEVINEIDVQVGEYRKKGIPEHIGLAECGMIIRRNNERVNAFNETWWAEVSRWSQRDQLSFPIARMKHPDVKINYINGNVREHKYFKYEPNNIPRR